MKTTDKDNLIFINGIRVILCLMVFVSHFYNFLGGRYVHGIRIIGAVGARAVDVFFFLTGFFTLLSYENRKQNPAAYFGHKLKRLYPEYIPAIIIASLTLPIFTSTQEMLLRFLTGNNIGAWGMTYTAKGFPDIRSVLIYLLFSNGIIPVKTGTVLGVAWCMPVEVYFYLIFCVLMLFCFRSKDNKTRKLIYKTFYVIFLVAGVIQRIIEGEDPQQTLLRSLPVMFMGVLMAEIYRERESGKIVEKIMVFTGIAYLFLLDPTQNWISSGIIIAVMSLLLFPDKFERIRKCLSLNLFVKGGSISFSFYLFHTIAISLVFWVLMKINEEITVIPAVLVILIALPVSLLITLGYSAVMTKLTGYVRKKDERR